MFACLNVRVCLPMHAIIVYMYIFVYIVSNNYRYADLTTDVSEHCLHAVDVDDELNAVIRQSDMVPFVLYDLK